MTRFTLLAVFLSSIANAQDVPPPPRPKADNAALALLLESFKQTLLGSGRVEYSWMAGNSNNRLWQKITSVIVDAPGCQARIHADRSFNGNDPIDQPIPLFFESIDTVEPLTQQEAHDRSRSRSGQARSQTFSEGVYTLAINGNTTFFLFSSEAHASKAAEAVSRAAQICRSAPVTLNEAGSPSLVETLHFIQDKLNDNGAVNYRGVNQNADGSPVGNPVSWSTRITEATTDPSKCLLRFNLSWVVNGNTVFADREVISFRRLEKLEVATEEDATSRARAQNSQTTSTYKTDPVVYRLSVRPLFGATLLLHFRDEEMTNRVAKAMNHAVELCGGGSRDPF